MIKVSVMYPNKPGARFDHAYYRGRHMPMAKARLGSTCSYYTVDKGLAGRAPGSPPAPTSSWRRTARSSGDCRRPAFAAAAMMNLHSARLSL